MAGVCTAYYRAMKGLADHLLKLSALALALPPDYFAAFNNAPISQLTMVSYPEQPEAPGETQAPREPAHRFRRAHPVARRRQAGRPPGAAERRRLAQRRAAGAGLLHRQHRRPDGALDQRPPGNRRCTAWSTRRATRR